MANRPGRRLRAEHDVVGADVEPLEPRHHVQVEEEVPEQRHMALVDADAEIADRAGVRIHLDEIDDVPARAQPVGDAVDDDLEAAGGVEIRLGDRDLHCRDRATSASSSAMRSARTKCACRLCSRSRASASSAKITSRLTSV